MTTDEQEAGKPGPILIILYLGLHELWRRFVVGNYAFVGLRLLFMAGTIAYYKFKAPSLSLRDLFGFGKWQAQNAKVLVFFLPICVALRMLIHHIFPNHGYLPIWEGDNGRCVINIAMIIYECVIPPLNEELFFRGLILSILLRELKQHVTFAVFLGAVIFANAHRVDSHTFIVTFIQAMLVYGPAYVRSRSVAVCMILHFVWNALIFAPLP
jgi:membrane protease YdiL (CAAX protease family)